jgi:hypothetical protein
MHNTVFLQEILQIPYDIVTCFISLPEKIILAKINLVEGCTQSNVVYVEGATYSPLTIDQCKYYCQLNPACTYFTWNTQTQVFS